MTRPIVYPELKPGDVVAYLTGRRPMTCVVDEIERVTATQIILTNGQRARRNDGRLIGDHYRYLCNPSWPSIVSVRIAMEHRRLESELHRALKAEESTSASGLDEWHGALADLLDDSRGRLAEIMRDVKTPTKRGTSNTNARGGSPARRTRKQWLLDEFGDGKTVACAFECGTVLDIDTVSPDRIIPGCDGGTYRRGNIRPACVPCQSKQGGALGASRRKAVTA